MLLVCFVLASLHVPQETNSELSALSCMKNVRALFTRHFPNVSLVI